MKVTERQKYTPAHLIGYDWLDALEGWVAADPTHGAQDRAWQVRPAERYGTMPGVVCCILFYTAPDAGGRKQTWSVQMIGHSVELIVWDAIRQFEGAAPREHGYTPFGKPLGVEMNRQLTLAEATCQN